MTLTLAATGMNPQTAFGSGSSGEFFPSPWLDMATMAMPDNNKNALAWSEYIWQSSGTYRMAAERVISYFLTDVELGAVDTQSSLGDDEKEQWDALFSDTLHILEVLQCMNRDRSCYGNAFATLVVPFKRMLVCPQTGAHYTFSEVTTNSVFQFQYEPSSNSFIATCPQTQKRGPWKVLDLPDDLEKKLKIKVWSPHEIEIIPDFYSGDCDYVWRIPEDYKREIRRGNLYMLERAPMEILRAVQLNGVFLFAKDAMFHMKEPTLGGIRSRGWGLSRTLVNFRDIWYVQVLRRYNEAIALDYVIPFRVIMPADRSGGGLASTTDTLRMNNQGNLRSIVNNMLRKRRRDPASWHFSPVPLEYKALGGDASQMAPTELLEQGYDTMLNAAGTPTDLYRGTLQLQAAPVSLRLFEATHHSQVNDNNSFLRWVVRQLTQLLPLQAVQARMKRVTHADDFNKQMALLQLMMGQAISQTSGLKALGMEYKDEQRLIGEEARYQQQLQADIQEEMEQAAFGEQIAKGQTGPGAPPAGEAAPAGEDPAAGSPGPVSGMLMNNSVPQTPQDMIAQAQSIAQELLGLPESQKDSELIALKKKNEVLHSLVRSQMDSLRQQARTAGGSMLLGQQPAVAG